MLYGLSVMASQRRKKEARPNRHAREGGGRRGPALELSELLAERPEPFLLVGEEGSCPILGFANPLETD